MSNITINITQAGIHHINYTCKECFNITNCPMPIATYYSNYQANWIFLIILAAVIIFLEAKFYESPFKAWAFAGGATLVLCLIGGYFDWITGLPLLVIEVVLAIVTLWRYKEELML